jgi:hypothetical protein
MICLGNAFNRFINDIVRRRIYNMYISSNNIEPITDRCDSIGLTSTNNDNQYEPVYINVTAALRHKIYG